MQETKATIQSIEPMSDKYRRLILATDWDAWTPGQFVMMRMPHGPAFIRRPFGIVDMRDGALEICFKMVGPGTKALAEAKVGDHIDVLGPLGKGFEVAKGKNHMLVAGGYGIAPILGLAHQLVETGEGATLFYGAKSKEHLLYRDELSRLSVDVVMTTEDGGVGRKGLVTEAIQDELQEMKGVALYACGPEPLMRAMAKLGKEKSVPVQVSMDRYMACGMGVCLGCMCTTKDGDNVRACREGPVFDARELKW